MQLTESQRQAFEGIQNIYHVHTTDIASVAGVSLRTIPLIIGPSGSGKTHIVNEFAKKFELPLFHLNVVNWIVRGAKNDSQITLEQIAEFINKNQAGVIFIDEINKLKLGHTESSSWTADVFSEVLAFLDHDERLMAMGFSEIIEKLKSKFFIIGAGAFQDIWIKTQKTTSHESAIGFGNVKDATTIEPEMNYTQLVQQDEQVPQELLSRFNEKICMISPPTKEEFARRITDIRNEIKMAKLSDEELDAEVALAEGSKKMFRYLEGYATDCMSKLSITQLQELSVELRRKTSISDESTSQSENTYARKASAKESTALYDTTYTNYAQALQKLFVDAMQIRSRLSYVLEHLTQQESINFSSMAWTEFDRIELLADCNLPNYTQTSCKMLQLLEHLSCLCQCIERPTITDAERGNVAAKIREIGMLFCKLEANFLSILISKGGEGAFLPWQSFVSSFLQADILFAFLIQLQQKSPIILR